MKDYYQILEASPEMTQEQIKEQQLYLVQACQPEKHTNPERKTKAQERLKDIHEAYECLKNPEKRAKYDSGYTPQPENSQRKATPGRNEDTENKQQQIAKLEREIAKLETRMAEQTGEVKKFSNWSIILVVALVAVGVLLLSSLFSPSISQISRVIPASGMALLFIAFLLINQRNSYYQKRYKPFLEKNKSVVEKINHLKYERNKLQFLR